MKPEFGGMCIVRIPRRAGW